MMRQCRLAIIVCGVLSVSACKSSFEAVENEPSQPIHDTVKEKLGASSEFRACLNDGKQGTVLKMVDDDTVEETRITFSDDYCVGKEITKVAVTYAASFTALAKNKTRLELARSGQKFYYTIEQLDGDLFTQESPSSSPTFTPTNYDQIFVTHDTANSWNAVTKGVKYVYCDGTKLNKYEIDSSNRWIVSTTYMSAADCIGPAQTTDRWIYEPVKIEHQALWQSLVDVKLLDFRFTIHDPTLLSTFNDGDDSLCNGNNWQVDVEQTCTPFQSEVIGQIYYLTLESHTSNILTNGLRPSTGISNRGTALDLNFVFEPL